jgi:hypothetical protein
MMIGRARTLSQKLLKFSDMSEANRPVLVGGLKETLFVKLVNLYLCINCKHTTSSGRSKVFYARDCRKSMLIEPPLFKAPVPECEQA